MAKLLNPLLSTSAKGTTSGITYSQWRGINSARRKGNPARRIRSLQPQNRTYIGYLSRTWAAVTAGNRELWKQWAANHPRPDGFGGVFQMSGINAYVSLNKVRLDRNGLAALSVAPPVADLAVTVQNLAAVTGALAGEIDCTWTLLGTGLATDFIEVGIAGPFASSGKFEVAGKFKFQAQVAGNLLLKDLTGLQAGAWYWISIRYVGADGQVSASLYSQAMAKV